MSIPRILGIAGSLRIGSINRRLLETATEALPAADWTIARLRAIPPYDADIEARSLPPAVDRLKDQIFAADAIVIASPEYNHSIPGVLKNALDWASRPAGRSPLSGKPVLLMGASPSSSGVARALQHLRIVLEAIDARPLPDELSIGRVREHLSDGEFDAAVLSDLRRVLGQLEAAKVVSAAR
jgi:chromate reductase, NAD(P)H dehydrogenase (quinone)